MENGTRVRVINETGNICANGVYHGTGIPTKEIKAVYHDMTHFAVLVSGELRYYPTGFFTLQVSPPGE